MKIRLYNKKKWVTICLLAGLTLGFRGCFHRHLGAETSEEMHRLLKFYNRLLPQQQKDLLAALKPLSQAQQDTLQHLVAGLSKQELESVKKLGDTPEQSSEDSNRTNLFEMLFTVLLNKNYTIEQLKKIINDVNENRFSSDSEEFMQAFIESARKETSNTKNYSFSSLASGTSKSHLAENWEEELKNLNINKNTKGNFTKLLNKFNNNNICNEKKADQEILHDLFKEQEKKYKETFINTLMGRKVHIQKELASDLLFLHKKNKNIAQKICQGETLSLFQQMSVYYILRKKHPKNYKKRIKNLQELGE